MAKSKKEERRYVSVKMVLVPVSDEQDGKKVFAVNKDGEVIYNRFFHLEVDFLGKKKTFFMKAKDKNLQSIMREFYDLQATDVLPAIIKTITIKNEEGESTVIPQCFLLMSKDDDNHMIEIVSSEADKAAFRMWEKDFLSGYEPSEQILKVRKERYEKVKAKNEAKEKPVTKK